MNIFPLLLLGGAAYLVMSKKGGGGKAHVQTFPSKAAAGNVLQSSVEDGAVIFAFHGYTKSSADAPVIEEVRQTLRTVSAKYPKVSFIEFPDKTVGDAIGGTLAIRIGDRGPEYLHLDGDLEGPWMILNSNEAAGEFGRAAQWAAGRIDVPESVVIADLTPEMAMEIARGLFGNLDPGGGAETPAPGNFSSLSIMVSGGGSNWSWSIEDMATQEVVAEGQAASEAAAQADAQAAMEEIEGQS